MQKLLSAMLIPLVSLSLNPRKATPPTPVASPIRDAAVPTTRPSTCPFEIDPATVSRMDITDLATNQTTLHSDRPMIEELCWFLRRERSGRLSRLEHKPSGTKYRITLRDSSCTHSLLVVTLHGDSIALDRSVTIGGDILSEGTYYNCSTDLSRDPLCHLRHEAEQHLHGVSFPANVDAPATDSYYELELLDHGKTEVTFREAFSILPDLITTFWTGKSFELTNFRRFSDYPARQSEYRRLETLCQCIRIRGRSRCWLSIKSGGVSTTVQILGDLLLARNPQESRCYWLLVNGDTILDVKVDRAFDERFEDIFARNKAGKPTKPISPQEVVRLCGGKGRFRINPSACIDYLYKNLGIDPYGCHSELAGVADLRLSGSPCTVMRILEGMGRICSRLLVYKRNPADNTSRFIGDVSYRDDGDGPGYTVERCGNSDWITVRSLFSQSTCPDRGTHWTWYRVTDRGIKEDLSIPVDWEEDYRVTDWEKLSLCARKESERDWDEAPKRFSLSARKESVSCDGGTLRISVEYEALKRYYLPENKYGTVELKGRKTAQFLWDNRRERFVSEDLISADDREMEPENVFNSCSEIQRKRDSFLAQHYKQLLADIAALDHASDELFCYEEFLKDCTNSPMKAELMRVLSARAHTGLRW